MTTRLLSEPDAVAAALHPIRRRLLALLDQPDSAVGLSRRTGLARQKVNYHLRTLEDDGLVRLVEERPRRGVTERILRRVDDVLLVDPGVLGVAGLHARDQVGLGGVMAAAVSLLRRAGLLAARAGATERRVAAVTMDAAVRLRDPAALRSLVADLADLIARHEDPHPDARTFRVTLTVLPDIAEDAEGKAADGAS